MIIHIQSVEIKTTASKAVYKVVTAQEGKFSFFAVTQQQPNPGYDLAINGAVIDAETENKPGKDGTVYHNILSAKPVQGQPPAKAAGQPDQLDQPDWKAKERASIEAQTAFRGTMDALARGVPINSDLAKAAQDWAIAKLRSSQQTNDGDVPF